MTSIFDWVSGVSPITWLAAIAALGYFIGRWRRRELDRGRKRDRQEIAQAMDVSHEMEAIANRLLGSFAAHLPAVNKFNTRLARLERMDSATRDEVCERADELLKTVLQMNSEISRAYGDLVQQMSQLSTFAEMRMDPLTGIGNRRAFDESLVTAMSQFSRYGTPTSLALCDIDHFKRVNDERGHLHGDRVLQELAELMTATIRETDQLFRFGGEEFVILMPHTDAAAAYALAERIRLATENDLGVTVSMGIAQVRSDDTCESLIARADEALYAAKSGGRNQVRLHDGQLSRFRGESTNERHDEKADEARVEAGVGGD